MNKKYSFSILVSRLHFRFIISCVSPFCNSKPNFYAVSGKYVFLVVFSLQSRFQSDLYGINMYSFEGEFRRGPVQSFGGASRKVRKYKSII